MMRRDGITGTPTSTHGFCCPNCGITTATIDSRDHSNGTAVRRRRECLGCGFRFTTMETVALPQGMNGRVYPRPLAIPRDPYSNFAVQYRARWELELHRRREKRNAT
jgi:hypothetical protein